MSGISTTYFDSRLGGDFDVLESSGTVKQGDGKGPGTGKRAGRKRKGSASGWPVGFDTERYRRRNTVERRFQKIKAWCGLATRYDKTPEARGLGKRVGGRRGSPASHNPKNSVISAQAGQLPTFSREYHGS
ncbi:hypothetical protein [Streptosporangium sp. NBC_01469]|uniref:hypothetical protein n=1 Tax=Streptosporangium sp. NBC_01469 TaxID=2903898 RepID=UPI003FCE4595